MLNCKPGDLAVIVTSPSTPQNVGKIVQVIRPAVRGETIEGWLIFFEEGHAAWVVESSGSLLAWASHKRPDGKMPINFVKRRAYSDCCLRPIRDHGDDEIDAISTTKKQSTSA